MYFFKEGEKVFTSKFVSGSVGEGWASPDGVYDINYKDCTDYHKGEKIELKGEDYASKVDYFIVWARNIGFHDASWRKAKEFGGTTYLKDGSHGCINMPYNSVKELFSLVSNGTPIVAYYREPVSVYLHEYAYSYVKPTETAE
jgi:lipoprotein-anchoring transpeptidase ErfK/SrfK